MTCLLTIGTLCLANIDPSITESSISVTQQNIMINETKETTLTKILVSNDLIKYTTQNKTQSVNGFIEEIKPKSIVSINRDQYKENSILPSSLDSLVAKSKFEISQRNIMKNGMIETILSTVLFSGKSVDIETKRSYMLNSKWVNYEINWKI